MAGGRVEGIPLAIDVHRAFAGSTEELDGRRVGLCASVGLVVGRDVDHDDLAGVDCRVVVVGVRG